MKASAALLPGCSAPRLLASWRRCVCPSPALTSRTRHPPLDPRERRRYGSEHRRRSMRISHGAALLLSGILGFAVACSVDAQPRKLKVFISADMEGIGGVSTWAIQAGP